MKGEHEYYCAKCDHLVASIPLDKDAEFLKLIDPDGRIQQQAVEAPESKL